MNKWIQMEVDEAEHQTGPGILTLRSQAPADAAKLDALCPRDQVRVFEAKWEDGNKLVFTERAVARATVGGGVTEPPLGEGEPDTGFATELDAEVARLTALEDKELKTIAAERSVAWDKKATRDTMVKKIAAAAPPPEVPPT